MISSSDFLPTTGHGDGHMTLEGMRSTMMYFTIQGPTGDPWVDGFANTYVLASPLPMATVSRAELLATYDRVIDRFEAAFSLPIRQVNFEKANEELTTLKTNPVDKARYGPLLNSIPRYERIQATCESYLGTTRRCDRGDFFGNVPSPAWELSGQCGRAHARCYCPQSRRIGSPAIQSNIG